MTSETTRTTTTTTTTTTPRTTYRKTRPPPTVKGCPAGPARPAPRASEVPIPVTRPPAPQIELPGPKTKPPVDEFLAAWGFFRHHNSLDPRNGSHWREFHGAGGPQRRDVAKKDVVVILPPWLRGPAPVPAKKLAKREEATTAPYQVYWFSSWPPAGSEVSRLPSRDQDNFIKLASWWQDVIKTYNGYQRKKRVVRR